MKNLINRLLFLLLFCCCSFLVQAQNASVATGGEASGSGGTLSYSVGQIAYLTNSNTNFSEAQGVQQPFEISMLTNTVELDGQQVKFYLFPNPTVGHLTLSLEGTAPDQLIYELYDLHGKLLAKQSLSGQQTDILVDQLPAATYLLKIIHQQQAVTIFKFLKN